MYWALAQFLWDRFRNKVPNEKLFAEFFDVLIEKHQVSITGEDIRDIGRTFIDKTAAATYVETVLQPRFVHLKTEFQDLVEKKKEEISCRMAIIKNEVETITLNLNEKNEKSELFALEMKKGETVAGAAEIEIVCFPEKQLKQYIDKTLEQFKVNVEGIIKAGTDNNQVMSYAEKQKEIIAFTNRESNSFKRMLDSFRQKIQSNHYPPRIQFIRFFYFLCFLLMVSEVGISMTIIRKITNNPFQGSMLTLVTIIYSIGISLSLAVIYKTLIDWFLFRGWSKGRWFVISHIIIVTIMSIFFSAEFGESVGAGIIKKQGLVLGFLSTCFALANGFLFREAAYLHDLYYKIYPDASIKQIDRKKERLRYKWNKLVDKKNKELLAISRQYESCAGSSVDEIYNHIERLENINITSFWLGFDSALAELVLNNHEITLVIIKKMRGKLT